VCRSGRLQRVRQFHGVVGYYPSGHTATAMVCAVILAAIGAQLRPDWRRLLATSASWTVLVGASMVFHRFHWPSDVFASLLLGAVIFLAVPLAGQRLRHHGLRRGLLPLEMDEDA